MCTECRLRFFVAIGGAILPIVGVIYIYETCVQLGKAEGSRMCLNSPRDTDTSDYICTE